MTFYEAALRVLESAGRPLHFLEITEKSISQNLLSHVGKTPEQTMLSRLAAMARRTRDRKVVVTAKDTFALTDWALPEDAEALAQTGIVEPHPEESLPPLRPVERHPDPRAENVRSAGRGERKRWRDEDEERPRKKRYPPMGEVAFDVLSEASEPLTPSELVNRARMRELFSEDQKTDQLLAALLEDNQRRIDAGRRPQFVWLADSGQLTLERTDVPSETPAEDVQAALAAAAGITMENGRPALPRGARPAETDEVLDGALTALKAAAKDARRAAAKGMRRRLLELDSGGFEKAMVKLLHALGFRELKGVKRSREGHLLTARKREGSVELRYAIRIPKGHAGVDRRTVLDLRRDLGHTHSQVGLIASPAEARGDAKAEAIGSGALVMLWCADALAEKFFEAKTGVHVRTVESYHVDDAFFESVRAEAEESRKRREERHKDRERPKSFEEAASPEAEEERPSAPVAAAPDSAEAEGVEDEEGGEADGPEDAGEERAEGKEGATPGAAASGEGRRRRRRRRGRRGKGPRPEGAAGASPPSGGEAAAAGGSESAPSGGESSSASAAPPPPPSSEPGSAG